MYDGFSYENGTVWLPPIKKLASDSMVLHLEWWSRNDILIVNSYFTCEKLTANNEGCGVFYESHNTVKISEIKPINKESVLEFDLTLQPNNFTEYSAGGFYLSETNTQGTAVIFDTYGKCKICTVINNKIEGIDDEISYGSCAPYYLESGKNYSVKVLIKNNMFEVYVDNKYLQTFNTTHFKDCEGKCIKGFAAISNRRECLLSNIKISKLKI